MLFFFYLDDSDQEPLLILLMHGPTDGSDGPAQGVEVLPGPFSAVDLVVKLLCHYAFCVCIIQVSQVHCRMVQKKKDIFIIGMRMLYCKLENNNLSIQL